MNEKTEPALLLAKVQEKETEIERLQKKLKEAEDSLAIFKKAEKEKKAAEKRWVNENCRRVGAKWSLIPKRDSRTDSYEQKLRQMGY